MIKLHNEKKGNLTKKQKKQMGLLNWNGKADVEQMCTLFMTFMTTPAVKTAVQLEEEDKQRLIKYAIDNPRLARKTATINIDDGGLEGNTIAEEPEVASDVSRN